jgi:antitoxin component YwqK of YwqJK toxin-antitoxin module
VVNFKNGRAEGTWEVFREDGTLQSKKSYKDNKRDGDWVTYHDDGKTIKIQETFANGLREGPAKAFYADGKPQREMTFKNNQLDGLLTEWDQSGRKVGEVMFKAGKRDGKFIMYRPDGSTDEYLYEDGRLVNTPPAG